MWFPVDPRWPLSDTFQGHLDRVPPSTAPGIDVACPTGTPVLSPGPGTITFSGWQSRGGPFGCSTTAGGCTYAT